MESDQNGSTKNPCFVKCQLFYAVWDKLLTYVKVRDYIHVVDLADGHTAALRKLFKSDINCEVYNLGTGKGTSVLEMVEAFERASGKKIPLLMDGRRPGDAEIVFASTEKGRARVEMES